MKHTGPPLTSSEKERIKVLSAGGKTSNAISNAVGRNRRTVKKFLDKPEVREQVGVQREELAGMFDGVAHRIVGSVTPTDIEKANLVQKMTSAGIAIDKAAMLRNEHPVTINVTAVWDIVALMKARDEQVERERVMSRALAPGTE